MKASSLPNNDWWDPELNPRGERLAQAGGPSDSPLEENHWLTWMFLITGAALLTFAAWKGRPGIDSAAS